jgi:beta-phosphoglucomutase-like phosphatase (HAD superfamily)
LTGGGGAAPGGEELRAVIFDMDGVLIDTEPVWRRIEMETFASLGAPLTEAECRETTGLRINESVELWYTRRPRPDVPPDAVAARILAEVIDEVNEHGVAADGALAAIAVARRAGLSCAVASSSPVPLIAAVVERLGITAAVDVICSAEQDEHGKPAPDVYLRAASLLGVPPAGCLAIEDSIYGVMSARAAGMACIVIPDEVTAADPRLDVASLRLQSLVDLDEERLASIRAAYFA